MKKISIFAIVLAFFGLTNLSSQVVLETSQELNKQQQPAFVVTYNFTQDIAEEAISRYLKSNKIKFKSSKGVFSCERVNYALLSSSTVDLYYKCIGDKKAGTTMVFIFVSKGYENFVSSATDPVVAANVSGMFSLLKEEARQVRIERQQEVIAGAQKEVDKSVKKLDDLKDQQRKIEDEINARRATVGKENQTLEDIKGEL
ncbi:hypothetical protein FACS1894180_6450 [Bacteroidia bacterium]|nr:hypothetical protein FACS1894178_2310 [Bacteroidia bacterium]GHV44743.1 hypothetical protein FACS1894180_6450 [Bacteroidia bacterium]